MNPLIQTGMTYRETGPQLEKNDLPSETQPDMTMSLQELLERHVRGLDVPQFPGNFEEEGEYIPDPRSLDLSDIARMKEENAQKIKDLKENPKPKAKPSSKQKSEAPQSGEADKPQTSDGQSSEPTGEPS